jgi:osmoprotectant transport system ATP-binding protein
MITIDGVRKSFGQTCVISHFSLEIPTGQTHILLGASGSGKTTLLRMIGGLTLPDEGRILLDQSPVNTLEPRERTTRLSDITQEGGLFPHLSALDNILLPARLRKKEKSEVLREVYELCEMVHLEKSLLDRLPQELSGGQRQRVSLVRGLILKPEVLLLDEPLSALDPIVRSSLQQELKTIFKSLKKTVIMVTHDIQEASFLGDEITLLNKGYAVQTSSFEELYHRPKENYVTDFLTAQLPVGLGS